ncbi:MAG: hypothetical protein ACOC53_08350 [Candidatus Saliniplasma sp.]
MAVIAVSYAMTVGNIASEPIIEMGFLVITLPSLLFTAGTLLLINLWSHLLTKFNKFMMSSSFLRVLFVAIIIFGVIAVIDLFLAWATPYEIGLINWLSELFG